MRASLLAIPCSSREKERERERERERVMKVGNGRMHEAYSYSRRRWANMYVVMVIVCSVLGCGILGLMRAHRLRERRSFSLLIKEKDEQILSLHLLLQKERDHLLEAKRKTEEMKMEITSLGSQKAELDGRIQDVEAKMMREKEQNPLAEALMEKLRLKQGEIEELKHPLKDATDGLGVGEIESSMTTSKEEIGKNSGTNAEGRIEEVEAKDGDDQERERREKDDGDVAATGALARTESQSSQNQEVEMHGGGMKMEMQDNPHRVRGKRSYLRRTKGKRRRPIAKASTMADQGDKLLNAESTGEGGEERPPGKVVQSEETEDSSGDALSSEKTHVSVEESTEKPSIKMEETGSDAVQNIEENEPLEEQSTIMKDSEGRSEQKDTDLLARKEAVQGGESEERELGEEKEERDEQEF